MIDFLLVIDKRARFSPSELGFMEGLGDLRQTRTDERSHFRARDTRLWVWHTSVEPFTSIQQNLSSDRTGLDLYEGHTLDHRGVPIGDVGAYLSAAGGGVRGHFLYVRVDPAGTGRLIRSRLPVHQVYYAENERTAVVSSRAMIAGAAAVGTTRLELDPDFVRTVVSMSITAHYATAFRHVRFLGVDESLSFGPEGLTVEDIGPGFIIDPNLTEAYLRSPDQYWDEAFERMKASLALLDVTSDELEFPLSGGKDSRLLLALLLATGRRERIAGIHTWGPTVDPEVHAAKIVCEVLDLPHRNVDSTTVTSERSVPLADKLAAHLLTTEGEMSPSSLPLGTWRVQPDHRTSITGQASGLRDQAKHRHPDAREAVARWFDVYFAHGDTLRTLRPASQQRNIDDIESFLDRIEASGLAWSDAPTLHRLRRWTGRWTSRLWKAKNSLGYAPFLFVDPDIVTMTMSAGAASRHREEFHAEFMRRLDPRLMRLPFAGQSWREEMYRGLFPSEQQPEPLVWPAGVPAYKRRPTHQAIRDNIEPLKRYLRRHAGPVTCSVVDFDRLEWLTQETLSSGHYQPLWQLVQCVLLEEASDIRSLTGDDPPFASMPPVDIVSAGT